MDGMAVTATNTEQRRQALKKGSKNTPPPPPNSKKVMKSAKKNPSTPALVTLYIILHLFIILFILWLLYKKIPFPMRRELVIPLWQY